MSSQNFDINLNYENAIITIIRGGGEPVYEKSEKPEIRKISRQCIFNLANTLFDPPSYYLDNRALSS
jgi:hypothetical protein